MRKLSSLFIVILVLCSGCSSIPREAWVPVVEKPFEYAIHQINEGMFVVIPFGIGAFAGSPTALVTGPMAFLCEPEKGEAEIGKDMVFFFLGPVVVGDIVGTPFLAIKKTFWDFPIWIFRKEDEENQSNMQLEQPDVNDSGKTKGSARSDDRRLNTPEKQPAAKVPSGPTAHGSHKARETGHTLPDPLTKYLYPGFLPASLYPSHPN